jgi:hypothetical protein
VTFCGSHGLVEAEGSKREDAGISTDCQELKQYQDCWLLHVMLCKVPYLSLQSECIILKERKLNIAPAIKKQVSDTHVYQ